MEVLSYHDCKPLRFRWRIHGKDLASLLPFAAKCGKYGEHARLGSAIAPSEPRAKYPFRSKIEHFVKVH